jgi:hypothetical protein
MKDFDLCLPLGKLDQPTTYKMLINYLNSVRPKNHQYDYDDPQAVAPFTEESAKLLCARSDGVPRWLNRLGAYVFHKAIQLEAEIITPDVLHQGLRYVDERLRTQLGLTPEDYYVLNLILEKGVLSDETITMSDLERLKVKEFSEILPSLDRLVQYDLIRRLPTDRVAEYRPTPILMGTTEQSNQKGD